MATRFSLKKAAVTLALLLGLIAAAALLPLVFRSGTAPREEVPRSTMALRDGVWYRTGQATPFSGVIVDHYESGARKWRCEVVQGLVHGVTEGWFTNGQLQVTEHFSAGVSSGLRTKWHPNGRKLSEVMIVHGKLEGTFRRWTEDGKLSEEIEMRNGTPDGLSRAFYPSGYLKAQARLRNGKVLEQNSWEDGQQMTASVARAGP